MLGRENVETYFSRKWLSFINQENEEITKTDS